MTIKKQKHILKRIKNQVSNFTIFFALFLLFFSSNNSKNCFAGLLNQEKGEGIIIPSIYFQSMNTIDTDSNKISHSRKVLQAIINLYGEYGLTKRITLGSKIIATGSMTTNRNTLGHVEDKTYALNVAEFYSKLAIIKNNDIFFLSLATQVGIPTLYDKRQINYFGVDKWSYETRIEAGLKFSKNDFLIITAGWHGYINHTYNEIRTEIVYGHYFIPEILLMLRFQKFFYIKNKNYTTTGLDSIFDFNAQDGFGKITVSIATPINKKTSLEIGAFSSVKSKITLTQNSNISLYGAYISLWYKF